MRPGSGIVLGFGLVFSFAACFEGDFARGLVCASDAECGPELRCVEGVCGGLGDEALCGNGLLEREELCDDGNTVDGDGCSARCDLCGNGSDDPGEECDDANTVDGDACTPACRFPACGDGFLAPGEVCDDGNELETDACTSSCAPPVCGDGFVNTDPETCDDGNEVETDACTTICTSSPHRPTLALGLSQVEQFELGWEPALGAEYYRAFERADVGEGFVQVGGDIVGESFSHTVPLYFRSRASYRLEACNAIRCVESEVVDVEGDLVEAIGYFKASNPGVEDHFGARVAIADDGNTLAVGAIGESSSARGIDGDQHDDSVPDAGAVYVFARDDERWSQQAYVKASDTSDVCDPGDVCDPASFGSVTLSADGNTMAVGAPGLYSVGSVYVFERRGESWSQQHQLQGMVGAWFGYGVALSNDGDTLAISAPRDSSAATGVDGNPDDSSAPGAGAVFVFVRDGEGWSQQAYVKASNTDLGDGFGGSVEPGAPGIALSDDGNTLVVGAVGEDSAATGIDGDQDDDSASASGAVYVFVREGESWSQQAYVKATNTGALDVFGVSVALSDDGNVLAVGATGEDSAATGIDGGQGDDFPPSENPEASVGAGATYVFVRDGESWSQQAYVKASNTGDDDLFGTSVALSNDGNVLAVGAVREDGAAAGVDGEQDNLQGDSGAVYVFVREGVQWSQRSYVKQPVPVQRFGKIVALEGDGSTLVVGNSEENGATPGVGNVPNDDSYQQAGAVFLY